MERNSTEIAFNRSEEACKKWKSLRDRYTREFKRFSDLKGTGTESQQLEIQSWDLFDNLSFLRDHIEPNKKTVTNYTPNNGSLAQATNEQSCGESTSSNHFICVEEENSSVKCSTSSCTTNTDSTPSRKVPKRKALEEINAHFMEATTSFTEMCSTVINRKQQPTEDELFGQRVVDFIASITDEDAKTDAKAAIIKYLADQILAQYD